MERTLTLSVATLGLSLALFACTSHMSSKAERTPIDFPEHLTCFADDYRRSLLIPRDMYADRFPDLEGNVIDGISFSMLPISYGDFTAFISLHRPDTIRPDCEFALVVYADSIGMATSKRVNVRSRGSFGVYIPNSLFAVNLNDNTIPDYSFFYAFDIGDGRYMRGICVMDEGDPVVMHAPYPVYPIDSTQRLNDLVFETSGDEQVERYLITQYIWIYDEIARRTAWECGGR